MSLSQRDLNQIKKFIEEKFDEKIKLLPTKDEFFQKMNEVIGELKTIRKEQIIVGHQVNNHEERISVFEKDQPVNPLLP